MKTRDIFNGIRSWLISLLSSTSETVFDVEGIKAPNTFTIMSKCERLYMNIPEWVDLEDGIKTAGFTKILCEEVAKLTTLGISIKFNNTVRGKALQSFVDKNYYNIREWVEYMCAYGTVAIKPNGKTIDFFTPSDFEIVSADDGDVTGIIFKDTIEDNGSYWNRLEYHRFENRKDIDGNEKKVYLISNKVFKSDNPTDIGKKVEIGASPWSYMQEESGEILKANGEPLDYPLFGILAVPNANNLDVKSVLHLPLVAGIMGDMENLDIAYSRLNEEIEDSRKITMVDDRIIKDPTGRNKLKLPRFIHSVLGSGIDTFYQESTPTINSTQRIEGINHILSHIGFKCGFSNGYFVFNQKSGMITATQVEADDRRTIQTIKDFRDQLEKCLRAIVYAQTVYMDIYGNVPVSDYEVNFDFGDITYNREEDKLTWWKYVASGKMPAWLYFVKFEGMTEQESRQLVEEAEPKDLERQFFND